MSFSGVHAGRGTEPSSKGPRPNTRVLYLRLFTVLFGFHTPGFWKPKHRGVTRGYPRSSPSVELTVGTTVGTRVSPVSLLSGSVAQGVVRVGTEGPHPELPPRVVSPDLVCLLPVTRTVTGESGGLETPEGSLASPALCFCSDRTLLPFVAEERGVVTPRGESLARPLLFYPC